MLREVRVDDDEDDECRGDVGGTRMAVTETSRGSKNDLVKDPLALSVDEQSFDAFLEQMPHAASVET